MRILLVEDNPGDARLLKEELAASSAVEPSRVLVSETLGAALDTLAREHVDVVLLDLSLPDSHGLETARKTIAAAPDVPTVVLTGSPDDSLAIAAVNLGAQDFLVKGQADASTIVRVVRYAVERKRAENTGKRLVTEQAARARVEAAERRSRFLAEASHGLSSSLDWEETLARLARLMVGPLADFCTVDIASDDGTLRRTATLHIDPRKQEIADGLRDFSVDMRRKEDPVVQAMRGRGAVVWTEIDDAKLQMMASSGEHAELLRKMAPRSALFVPVCARKRTLGVLGFFSVHGARYNAEDVELAIELADRAGLALDNARLYAQAQQATQTRDEVIAIVSHDLRNPLNVIAMTVALLAEDRKAPGPDDRRTKHVEKLQRAIDRMTELIEDLVDISRIDAGRLVLELARVECGALLEEGLEVLRAMVIADGMTFEVRIAPGVSPVKADRSRAIEVLSKLVKHVATISRAGSKLHLVAEGVGTREVRFGATSATAAVSDEQLATVFDRDWQGRRGRRDSEGIGLAIAKGIVEAHGGRAWAERRDGEVGLWFTLPADTSPEP